MAGILLKKNAAVAITAVIILFSMTVGAGRGLGNMRKTVYNIFYTGTDNDNISIENDMRARIDTAYNLASVAKKYFGGDDKVLLDVLSARESLIQADSILLKYNANLNLTMACDDLYLALKDAEMSEQDANYRESLNNSLKSRNNTIEYDMRIYVAQAVEFNNKLNAFPAALARIFGLVKPLDVI